jgi:hypothetical protein
MGYKKNVGTMIFIGEEIVASYFSYGSQAASLPRCWFCYGLRVILVAGLPAVGMVTGRRRRVFNSLACLAAKPRCYCFANFDFQLLFVAGYGFAGMAFKTSLLPNSSGSGLACILCMFHSK